MKFIKYIVIFAFVFSSCKSKKVATEGTVGIKNFSARKIAKKHIAANFDKNTVDAKLKVLYKSDKENIGFSVRMKIKKDEVIYLKGSKIITVFKAKITPKKISFYSPLKNSYMEGDFSIVKKLLGVEVTFEQLQNMLLGQAMLNVKSKKQEVKIVSQSYQLSPIKQSELFDVFFFINPIHFKLDKQSLVNSFKNQRLDIAYPKYVRKKEITFPERINILATENNRSTNIDITVRSVVFNTDLSMPFRIPNGYKKINI